LGDSKRRNGSIGDIPSEKEVRVFTMDKCRSREAQKQQKCHISHLSLSLSLSLSLK